MTGWLCMEECGLNTKLPLPAVSRDEDVVVLLQRSLRDPDVTRDLPDERRRRRRMTMKGVDREDGRACLPALNRWRSD